MDERPETSERLTPSEERLAGLLVLLRDERVPDGADLTEAVVRTARWQLVLRGAGLAVADVAAAVVHGLAILVGVPGRRRG